jgi:subtilisin family serine protease
VQIEKSYKVQKATVHTPYYLGLPKGIWAQEGGYLGAGEGIVIGLVDTGIDPTHPSFSVQGQKPYEPLRSYTGKCEVAPEFPLGSCNGKIIGAQHFAAAASKDGVFNASLYFASPLDGDGHGRLASPFSPLRCSFLRMQVYPRTGKKIFLACFGVWSQNCPFF